VPVLVTRSPLASQCWAAAKTGRPCTLAMRCDIEIQYYPRPPHPLCESTITSDNHHLLVLSWKPKLPQTSLPFSRLARFQYHSLARSGSSHSQFMGGLKDCRMSVANTYNLHSRNLSTFLSYTKPISLTTTHGAAEERGDSEWCRCSVRTGCCGHWSAYSGDWGFWLEVLERETHSTMLHPTAQWSANQSCRTILKKFHTIPREPELSYRIFYRTFPPHPTPPPTSKLLPPPIITPTPILPSPPRPPLDQLN